MKRLINHIIKNGALKTAVGLMLITVLGAGCKTPYQPVTTSTDFKYLVVEGVINPSDSTFFKLSRTTPISKVVPAPELKAVITIENQQNVSYALKETGNGNYTAASFNLDNTQQYRLRIKTAAGQVYLSDFVPMKNSQPIDSVGYTIGDDELQIYVNTHDATGNTRYYRWDFDETWQFNTKYFSGYTTDGMQVITRGMSNLVNQCFGNGNSSIINLAADAQLSQDNIYQNVVNTIPSTSEKVSIKYSILVKQYALTVDAYAFWLNIKKNTEDLGSIFDAQPSTISGNIHNINNPGEPVIGYVSAGTVQTKRIFISRSALPTGWRVLYPYQCGIDTAKAATITMLLVPNNPILANPIDKAYDVKGNYVGYLYSTIPCTDCTIRGVIKAPAFWK